MVVGGAVKFLSMAPEDNSMNLISRQSKNLTIGALSLLILLIWKFPSFWFKPDESPGRVKWFREILTFKGWTYGEIPVGEAAEAILAADEMKNGEFTSANGGVVRVFSAKRYSEKENATGLLTHTPDICWTRVGLKALDVEPFFTIKVIDGVSLNLERRIFTKGRLRELVYFGAIVGGKPLPYRMDLYLRAALGKTITGQTHGPMSRVVNPRVWSWALESFISRTRFSGSQQLIRISTPVDGDLEAAEARIDSVLTSWLEVETEP